MRKTAVLMVLVWSLISQSTVFSEKVDCLDILRKASEKLEKATSQEMILGMSFDMKMFKEKTNMTVNTAIEFISKPQVLGKIYMLRDGEKMHGDGAEPLAYLEQYGDKYIIYSKSGDKWTKKEISDYSDAFGKTDFLKEVQSAELVMENSDYYVFDVSILSKNAGAMARKMFSGMGSSASTMQNKIDEPVEMRLLAKYDRKTGYVSEMSIDMTASMDVFCQELSKAMLGDVELKNGSQYKLISIDKCIITVKTDKVNQIAPFGIPDEIRKQAISLEKA